VPFAKALCLLCLMGLVVVAEEAIMRCGLHGDRQTSSEGRMVRPVDIAVPPGCRIEPVAWGSAVPSAGRSRRMSNSM
jgi:hypothetical protein